MSENEVMYESGQAAPALTLDVSPYLTKPRWMGRVIALAILIPSLPLIGLLIVLTRISSAGPGLYRQTRVGKKGRIYVMYKVRTMVQDAECETGPQWTRKNDPRVTTLGRVLRRFHLDELPQLFNVARGEMALMGPRPERPALVHVLDQRIPGYINRLAVLPGITGLAQINLPPDTDLKSVQQKLHLDLEYVRCGTVWLDIRMFVWTCMRMLCCPSSIATRVTCLARTVPPEILESYTDSGTAEPLTIETILGAPEETDLQTTLLDLDDNCSADMQTASESTAEA